jgi:hypothetical protein
MGRLVTEDARLAVAAATMAPSVHNSQPWLFQVGDDGIDLFADERRWLKAIDSDRRQLHVSCGAAALHLRLALRDLGYGLVWEWLPEPAEPDHLLRVRVTGREPPTPQETQLTEAIPARHTDRSAFEPRSLPDEVVENLRAAAAVEGAWLRPIRTGEDEVRLAVLLNEAGSAELADAGYRAELSDWVWQQAAPGGRRDGIPPAALPADPPGGRATTLPLREFRPLPPAAGADCGPLRPPERPLTAIVGTPADDRTAWLQAGAATERLLLQATLDGVDASFLNQVVDLPGYRLRLRQELRLVGFPQMVLRLGYGHAWPVTPRRPVDEVIASAGPPGPAETR